MKTIFHKRFNFSVSISTPRVTCIARLLPLAAIMVAVSGCKTWKCGRNPEYKKDYEYTIDEGAITINKYIGANSEVTIPRKIEGLRVTSIGDTAFGGYTNLTSVTIPNSVTSIQDLAFDSCTSLTNATIGNRVVSIGDMAFFFCTNLTSVVIPNSVTNIEQFTFGNCPSLTGITVNARNAFYSSVNGVLFNKKQTRLIQYPDKKAKSYAIPNKVTIIGRAAFESCTSLTNVTIPGSVTSIEDNAFWH